MLGCKDVHPAPAAEAERSRRASRASRGFRRPRPKAMPIAGVRSGPKAVVRRPRASEGRLKGKTTGGRAEQASNIACGTPESWRTYGSEYRTALYRKASSRLSAARRSGPRVRRGPGVPRALLSWVRFFSKLGRNAPRECGRLDENNQMMSEAMSERPTPLCSPPPCGEGLGVGVVHWGTMVTTNSDPHPDAHCVRVDPPRKGEGKDRARGEERRDQSKNQIRQTPFQIHIFGLLSQNCHVHCA